MYNLQLTMYNYDIMRLLATTSAFFMSKNAREIRGGLGSSNARKVSICTLNIPLILLTFKTNAL